MNAKQERFIQEFLLDLNATQAAVRAGYSRKTAAEQAFALLRKPQIRKAIDEATDERAARTQADQDAVIRRLVAVAFADLGDFSQWDAEGNLTITPFEELDPEKRQAIKDVTTSVTTRQGRSGEIVVSAKTTLRLHDSLKALEMLCRHLGMFMDRSKVEIDGALGLGQLFEEVRKKARESGLSSEVEPRGGATA
jgi:phage terminase small subunit